MGVVLLLHCPNVSAQSIAATKPGLNGSGFRCDVVETNGVRQTRRFVGHWPHCNSVMQRSSRTARIGLPSGWLHHLHRSGSAQCPHTASAITAMPRLLAPFIGGPEPPAATIPDPNHATRNITLESVASCQTPNAIPFKRSLLGYRPSWVVGGCSVTATEKPGGRPPPLLMREVAPPGLLEASATPSAGHEGGGGTARGHSQGPGMHLQAWVTPHLRRSACIDSAPLMCDTRAACDRWQGRGRRGSSLLAIGGSGEASLSTIDLHATATPPPNGTTTPPSWCTEGHME